MIDAAGPRRGKHWGGARSARWAAVALSVAGVMSAGEPAPVNVRTAPGRFDLAAVDASVAHAVAAAAEEGWRLLAPVLGLPDAFPTPVYVRLIAETAVDGGGAFRTEVEPGGIVSLRLAVKNAPMATVRRALVQALLYRLAVARHGAREGVTVPLWLEHAGAEWWRTRAEAAQFDALKQESAGMAPPALDSILGWQRGTLEPRPLAVGAVWLLGLLQVESTRAREWPTLLTRLLGGEESGLVLAECYPARFSDRDDRELWWQTGYHHLRRVRSLPVLEPADSRAQLEALHRFVFAGPDEDTDIVEPLRATLARGAEPLVMAEIARRRLELERLIPALHPFYRNAGLSLAAALRDGVRSAVRREALCAAFEADWRDADELAVATRAALDALEERRATAPRSGS